MKTELVFTFISNILYMEDASDEMVESLSKASDASMNPFIAAMKTMDYFVSSISSCAVLTDMAIIHYTTVVLTPINFSKQERDSLAGDVEMKVTAIDFKDLPQEVKSAIEEQIRERTTDDKAKTIH